MSDYLLLADDIGTAQIMTLDETAVYLELGKYDILNRIEDGTFPCPIKVEINGCTAVGFSSCQIEDWDNEHPRF